MINPNPPKPDPKAAIIVHGRQHAEGLPQAAWFRAEDKPAAKAGAAEMRLSVIDLKSDAEKALAVGVHEGVLKGSGRMIVGAVEPEVYRRIEDYARKLAGSDVQAGAVGSSETAPASTETKASSEPQSTAAVLPSSPTAAPSGAGIPVSPWDSLRIGGTVLAAYWNEDKELEGFWPAIVVRADKNEVVLKWRDTPKDPLGKVQRKYIAILHPEFIASGE
jgi:hypothetical protein